MSEVCLFYCLTPAPSCSQCQCLKPPVNCNRYIGRYGQTWDDCTLTGLEPRPLRGTLNIIMPWRRVSQSSVSIHTWARRAKLPSNLGDCWQSNPSPWKPCLHLNGFFLSHIKCVSPANAVVVRCWYTVSVWIAYCRVFVAWTSGRTQVAVPFKPSEEQSFKTFLFWNSHTLKSHKHTGNLLRRH